MTAPLAAQYRDILIVGVGDFLVLERGPMPAASQSASRSMRNAGTGSSCRRATGERARGDRDDGGIRTRADCGWRGRGRGRTPRRA